MVIGFFFFFNIINGIFDLEKRFRETDYRIYWVFRFFKDYVVFFIVFGLLVLNRGKDGRVSFYF